MNLQDIPKLKHTTSDNFFLLAGPCAIESETMALQIAEKVCKITDALEIPYIFKGSFKKANRSRIDSFTGIGDEKALKILRKVSETFDIPTVTDIHEVSDAAMAAQYVDVLQIPAFLVRQTDLVVAAAKTGKVVNLKKGQFMSPEAMKHAVQKVKDAGNEKAWIYLIKYYLKNNNLRQAKYLASKALNNNHNSIKIIELNAVIYRDTGDISEAIKFYNQIFSKTTSNICFINSIIFYIV